MSNEPTQATRNEFEELYASANEELYPGCDYVTRLDFMAKFTYFKAKGRLTDSIFNEMLEFYQNLFPIVNGSSTHRHTLSQSETFKTIGLGYESIHACEHDCCLFRGDNNKDLDFCPVCNTSRWKDSNTPGKKVPKKVLRYFPIIPRLQRLYKSSHTAKDIFGNATGKVTEPEIVPTRLLLMVFNPLGNLSHPTACAGDIEQHNNLPPWTEGFMDLKGVETIAFVQARSYKACPTCNEDTPYVRVLSKIAYVGHRRFLKCPINGGVALEFNAKHDNTDPPKEWPDVILASNLIDAPRV
ncbi:protein kinase, ATP binding site-containing protein [Tanacetum coccineum]